MNTPLTGIGSCSLEPVPENKSRVSGTRVRSGSLIPILSQKFPVKTPEFLQTQFS